MTTTKKQLSIEQKVAAESPYQRACAIWIANTLNAERARGRHNAPEKRVNPARIYGVDFDMEYDEGCPTCGPETWMGLRYYHEGKSMKYELRRTVTPGRFLEECVAILKGMEG